MKRLIVSILLLLATHVAHAADDFETVDIRVLHVGGAGWRVRYRLEQPVDQLRFVNDFGLRRHDHWKIESPGFRLIAKNGKEYIERENGKPFREVSVRFASDFTKLDKNYPLNKAFTDGSEWLCTVHLYAVPSRGIPQKREAHFRIQFVPSPGESVVLDGQRTRGTVNWVDPRGDRGTFVYFGRLAPIETTDVIAIVDPGLPPYLEEQFNTLLPKLFAYYRERTGYALRRRPVIFITYDPREERNQGDSGDVLPNVIAFDFRNGKFWSAQSPANRRMSFHLLAHEAAHLWNGNQFESVEGDAAPWMHEGGADAFDWAASRDFGVLGDDALRAEVEQNLNKCLYRLTPLGTSLQEAFKQSVYELGYSCGSVMNFAVDAELRDRGGLFAFWRALFTQADKSGNRYDVGQYFATLRSLDPDGGLANALSDFWTAPQADPAQFLRVMLSAAWVVLGPGTVPPEFEKLYARKAMGTLMWSDCDGAFSFSSADELRYEITGLPQCHVLKNRNVTVIGLAGEKFSEPSRLYAAVMKRCAERGNVTAQLAGSDEPLSLHCSESLPAIVPYLAITSWPH